MDRAKFSRDVAWNVASLGVVGACGILFNYLIGTVYGAVALGVFNQVFAVFLLGSQLGALGIHYSVLKYVAGVDAREERRAITGAALLVTAVVGAAFAGVVYAAAPLIGRALDSAEVTTGTRYAAPGILLYSLSKVTLAALNGLRRMRAYALLFAGRFVFMIAGFAACVALDVDRAALPVILTVAELATFALSLVALHGELGVVPAAALRRWAAEHARFGSRGFGSGMLAELNTRLNVLVLGGFAGDAIVGAFSFAAVLAEGILQLLVVLRTNYAPLLIRMWIEGRRDELVALVHRVRVRVYGGAVLVGAAVVGGYALVVPAVTASPELAGSWRFFAVLVAGMVASAGYQPFLQLLIYAGLPGLHTILMAASLALNAAGCVALIALVGPIGAALAAALTFVATVVILRVLVARRLGIRI